MQHNFVLEFCVHPLEQHQLPIGLKLYSPYHEKCQRSHHEPRSAMEGYRRSGLTHLLGRQVKHMWLVIKQLSMKPGL